jgi:hypothetical protein
MLGERESTQACCVGQYPTGRTRAGLARPAAAALPAQPKRTAQQRVEAHAAKGLTCHAA